jgi:hypothetical protein
VVENRLPFRQAPIAFRPQHVGLVREFTAGDRHRDLTLKPESSLRRRRVRCGRGEARHLRRHPSLRRHYSASTFVSVPDYCRRLDLESDIEADTLAPNGSPPITRTTFRRDAPITRRIKRSSVDCFAAYRSSPCGRRVGIRIVTFEACSRFLAAAQQLDGRGQHARRTIAVAQRLSPVRCARKTQHVRSYLMHLRAAR